MSLPTPNVDQLYASVTKPLQENCKIYETTKQTQTKTYLNQINRKLRYVINPTRNS